MLRILLVLGVLFLTACADGGGTTPTTEFSHPIVGTWQQSNGRNYTFGSNRQLTFQVTDQSGGTGCVASYSITYAVDGSTVTLSNEQVTANSEAACQAYANASVGGPWQDLNVIYAYLADGAYALALPTTNTMGLTASGSGTQITYTRQ